MVVDNLEKNGMVTRKRDPDDRRAVRIHLTEKGRTFIGELFPRHLKRVKKEFSILSKAELIELGRICKKIGLQ